MKRYFSLVFACVFLMSCPSFSEDGRNVILTEAEYDQVMTALKTCQSDLKQSKQKLENVQNQSEQLTRQLQEQSKSLKTQKSEQTKMLIEGCAVSFSIGFSAGILLFYLKK